jgi:hypothetical protein
LLELTSPVITGNNEPPICANTKTNESAVERISAGKSLEPTEMPCFDQQLLCMRTLIRLTVAKRGPEKKPNRLIATAATIIFGTLVTCQHERRLASNNFTLTARIVSVGQCR